MNEDFFNFCWLQRIFWCLGGPAALDVAGQKALRATLNKLQSQIEKGESE